MNNFREEFSIPNGARRAWYVRMAVECSCGHERIIVAARGRANEEVARRNAARYSICEACEAEMFAAARAEREARERAASEAAASEAARRAARRAAIEARAAASEA